MRVQRETIRRLWLVLAAATLVALLAACGVGAATDGTGGPSAPVATCATNCGVGPGVQGVRVFVEPDAGVTPLLAAIEGANKSVWVEVYLLTDSSIIHALEDTASRGVDVRVLLETHPYGVGSTSPQQTLDELSAAGVKAQASDPAYYYTHEKAMIVDGATVYIMTCNLTRSGLGGSSSATNREYGVIDTNSADVQGVVNIFNADWNHSSVQVGDPNLVVSPINSRAKLGALIGGAHHTLQVEDEEMYDTASEDELIAAAKRGVPVEVILPAPSSGSSGSSDVDRLLAGGVHVRYISSLYMHAKLILADGSLGFVGSENFSATSLDKNREVGLLIADSGALGTLGQTFQSDWSNSSDASSS